MKMFQVSKCSLHIKQYVEFKMSVLISPSKSPISSRWVTYHCTHGQTKNVWKGFFFSFFSVERVMHILSENIYFQEKGFFFFLNPPLLPAGFSTLPWSNPPLCQLQLFLSQNIGLCDLFPVLLECYSSRFSCDRYGQFVVPFPKFAKIKHKKFWNYCDLALRSYTLLLSNFVFDITFKWIH